MLDGVVAVVQARRGFLGLVAPDGPWRLLAARDASGTDLADPTAQISTTILDACLRTGAPIVTEDAGDGDFAGQASVMRLELRSVACFPLRRGEATEGFIYLDNPLEQGLFDDAALAAVSAWRPFLSTCVTRAADAESAPSTGLPGVVTRSAAMQAELQELGRIARFDVSVLIPGETGTGKSLIAQQLHAASDRRSRPFIHVNCGAIPEALIEGELFGAEAGSYTGASTRRIGKFEAAEGGTLFLDELDSMPLACQVKLLVALQERKVQRLGSHTPVPVDVWVVPAMGADPAAAIRDGRLREDLYYRLAVFVAHPPLRERLDDVPLLARHFLREAAERYRLPPLTLTLTPAAIDDLTRHTWPGNVRELANTLDRAALLARDGRIERVSFQGRTTGAKSTENNHPQGVLATINAAARRLVTAMTERPALRQLDTAEAFRGLVLLHAAREQGARATAFEWLGQARQVANRNHNRVFRRELHRVEDVAAALGERIPADAARAADL